MVKVKLGLFNLKTKQIQWYSLGLFIFTDYSFQYDSTTNSLSLSCVDLMANLTGLRSGQFPSLTKKVEVNTNIRTNMISTITQFGKIKKYLISEAELPRHRTVPYTLEFGASATMYEILKKMADLHNPMEMFFDEDVFVAREISITNADPSVLDYTILEKLIISENSSGTFSDIKNCIEIWGKDGLNGRVMLYNKLPTPQDSNIKYVIDSNSPYSVEKIGEIWDVLSSGDYENIYTQELIYDRCSYELWSKTALKDVINIDCILIPFLQPNQKIRYKKLTSNEIVSLMVQSISFDFATGQCNINMNTFTPLYKWLE